VNAVRLPLAPALLGLLFWNAGLARAGETPGQRPPLVSIPLTVHDSIPYLKVRVNGSEPLLFVLDSGASSCVIDRARCKALGITPEGKGQIHGAGEGAVDIAYAKDVRYTVGDYTFRADRSYVIEDLAGASTPAEWKEAGLLGYQFFRDHVVAIDYEQSRLTVYKPGDFEYRGTGEVLPFVLKRNIPFVKGKIRIPGHALTADREWLVDTGSGDTLNDDLFAASTGQKTELMGGNGLGKQFKVWQSTAERVELGRLHFSDVAGVSGGMKVGGGLLRNFTAVFDYPGKRLILEPNRRYQR
jgi:hypothetical protein